MLKKLFYFLIFFSSICQAAENQALPPEINRWTKEHAVINAGFIDNAPPYSFLNKNGKPEGIAADYMKNLEEAAGFKFKIIPIANWTEGMKLWNAGKIDIFSFLPTNSMLAPNIVSGQPYITSSLGIFGRKSSSYINNLDDVGDKQIALTPNSKIHPSLTKDTQHKFILFDNAADALRSVNEGKTDLYIGDILHTKYAIEELHLKNIKYQAPIIGSAYGFSFAAASENADFIAAADILLNLIPEKKHKYFKQKWIISADEKQLSLKKYFLAATVLCCGFLLLIFLILRRGRFLRQRASKLAQTRKLEAIGRLAGGIAHDYNNMLAGIKGAAEVLSNKIDSDDSLHKYTDIILKACDRAAGLTSQLLIFSREKEKEFTDLSFNQIVDETAVLLEHGLNKNINFTISKKAKECTIRGNRDLIQSLILNLAVNAKDAVGENGKISLSTRDITLSKEQLHKCLIHAPAGDYIELRIADNGCGIPRSIRHKIFEPYFTTKDIGKGSGIGLAAVYGIVREHKGTLSFDTSRRGTCFHIYFPRVNNLKIEEKEKTAPICVNATILAVDDENILLELLKDILKILKATPLTAKDANTAMDIYKANAEKIDAAMIDVLMPGISGINLYHQLRKANKSLKIIFMSGYSPGNELDAILKNDPFTGFVQKPYSIAECGKELNRLFKC